MIKIILFTIILSLCSINVDAKELRVAIGSSLSPLHFSDKQGNLQGFEVDLIKEFAEKTDQKIVFLDPARYSMSSLKMVISGKADMAINAISITEKRKKWVKFSQPYFTSGTALLVKKGTGAKKFDFFNRTYLLIKNSPYYGLLPYELRSKIKWVNSIDEATALIKKENMLDYKPYALIHDWVALRNYAKKNEGFALLNFFLTADEYGAAFPLNADTGDWDNYIQEAKKTGRYQEIHNKWFAAKATPEIATIPSKPVRSKKNVWADAYKEGKLDTMSYPQLLTFLNENKHRYSKQAVDTYGIIKKRYNSKWLPYLKEILIKGESKDRRRFFFSDFVIEKDILGLLPELLKKPYITSSRWLPVIIATHERHIKMRKIIDAAYESVISGTKLKLKFMSGMDDSSSSRATVSIKTPDNKKRIFEVSTNKSVEIEILKSKIEDLLNIKVNGVAGELQSMTISGDSSLNIVNVNSGVVDGFSFPSDFSYTGVVDGGRTILFDYKGFRFYFDVRKKSISRLEFINPMKEKKYRDIALGKIAGLRSFNTGITNKGETYYLEFDRKNENKCTFYIKDAVTGKLNKQSTSVSCNSNGHIMDNKMFSATIGYDSYAPYNALDLKTGLNIDAGVGGGLVPIGEHKLYYCPVCCWESNASKEDLIPVVIDTRTLERTKINIDNLPCPGKTGKMEPHPEPNHYIYLDWTLC